MRDEYTNLRVQVDQLHPAGELRFTAVEAIILAKVSPGGGWRYGDRVRLQGYLSNVVSQSIFALTMALSSLLSEYAVG